MNKKSISISAILIPLVVVIFNVLIIIFPKDTITAAKEGLTLWFNTVLPSLLPFVIGANILTQWGAVNFIGTLLEPIMKPLFGVSGQGGFAFVIGIMSGYPMGAKITSELRENDEITKIEAERLISFTNNSGPLFILGAIGLMFQNMNFAYFVLTIHYLSAITVGLLFRFYKIDKNELIISKERKLSTQHIFRKAYKSMLDKKTKKSFGTILGDSVYKAMETMLLIGGFIVLFSVIVKAIEIVGAFDLLINVIGNQADKMLISSVFSGMIEMTNGCKILSQSGNSLTREIAVATAAIISFGGLSIHAQAISFISKTDINPLIYFGAKIINAIIAIAYGNLIFPLFKNGIETAEAISVSTVITSQNPLINSIMYFFIALLILACIVIIASFKPFSRFKKYNPK